MTVLATPSGLVPLHQAKASPIARAGRPVPSGPSPGRVPLLSREVAAATYEGMYRSQVWIYVVANRLARGVARLPLKVFRFLDSQGEARERVRGSALGKLLGSPWPRASAFDLKRAAVESLGVHGSALLAKAREDRAGPPTELWVVPWRHVEVVCSPAGGVDLYIFHGQERRIPLDPADVIHLRTTAGAVGVSPIEALRRTLALEDAAQRWSAGHFEKGAAPSGAFSTDKALTKDSIPRLREELDRIYGGVDNAGRFAVLDQGLHFQAIMQSAVDTALIEQRRLSREEVAAAYDIPPPMIGILDHSSFANVTELRRSQYVDTLGPWLTMIEEDLLAQLVRDEPAFAGEFVEFDLNEVLRGDPEQRSAAYQRYIQSGIYTPNEIRRLENLPPIDHPDADRILLPLNMIPVGAPREEIEARARAVFAIGPGPEEAGPAKEIAPLLEQAEFARAEAEREAARVKAQLDRARASRRLAVHRDDDGLIRAIEESWSPNGDGR